MIRKSLTTLCLAAALTVPVGNAAALVRTVRLAAAPKKVVTNIVVDGPVVKCRAWGFMELQLNITKTVTGDGPHPTVSIKITAVSWPIYPDHTPRSKYINAQALPLLQQEVMQLQATSGADLQNIAGASNTTDAWTVSLQAALIKAGVPASQVGGAPKGDWPVVSSTS